MLKMSLLKGVLSAKERENVCVNYPIPFGVFQLPVEDSSVLISIYVHQISFFFNQTCSTLSFFIGKII